jgi:hypothetical protein
MIVVYQVLLALVRVGTNLLAVPVWGGIILAVVSLFTADTVRGAFASAFASSLDWSFTSVPGLMVTGIFGVMGVIHAVRMFQAETYVSGLGFLGFMLDNSWGLPNTVLGSVFATISVGMEIDKPLSKGSSRLVTRNGIFGNYATTFGNVTTGTLVPRHEMVHVYQARVLGPLFYPIYAVNYVLNLVPYWWLLKLIFNIYPRAPINSFATYFTRGVYPFTLFELMAYAVEGSPP